MKKSRLRRNITADDDYSAYSVSIIVPDIQDKIVDKDLNHTYGPGISREWLFNKDLTSPEWDLLKS